MLKTVLVLPNFRSGSVWTPKAPPLELKILWIESTLKILPSGDKKTQPNYTLVELLTSKVRVKNPFTRLRAAGCHGGLFEVFCSYLGVIHLQMT